MKRWVIKREDGTYMRDSYPEKWTKNIEQACIIEYGQGFQIATNEKRVRVYLTTEKPK